MKTYRVRFTPDAEDDLLRLFDFLLEKDHDAASRARDAIEVAVELLSFSPFSCRKAAGNPLLRELVIPFALGRLRCALRNRRSCNGDDPPGSPSARGRLPLKSKR